LHRCFELTRLIPAIDLVHKPLFTIGRTTPHKATDEVNGIADYIPENSSCSKLKAGFGLELFERPLSSWLVFLARCLSRCSTLGLLGSEDHRSTVEELRAVGINSGGIYIEVLLRNVRGLNNTGTRDLHDVCLGSPHRLNGTTSFNYDLVGIYVHQPLGESC
jgi:hypothetical protein